MPAASNKARLLVVIKWPPPGLKNETNVEMPKTPVPQMAT